MAAQSTRTALAGLAALVLVGSVLWIVLGRVGGGGPGIHSAQAYYYDVQTGKLFTAGAGLTAPIASPSGEGLGVRAVVVGCGGCGAEKLKALRLEKLSAEAKAAASDASADPRSKAEALTRGAMVALAPAAAGGEIAWHSQSSGPGREIMSADPQKLCSGEPAQFCSP